MRFSIITPHFNGGEWLKVCVASVADQTGVELEHLIQDACSTDGSLEKIGSGNIKVVSEKDEGMYDAINRGFRRAQGEILAHLNADEQYLPGALARVKECFERDPDLDILYADTVVVDGEGAFICCRKAMTPWALLKYVQNPTITSSIFLRKRVVEEDGLLFDTRWRVLGDAVWMRESLQRGLKMSVLRAYTSVFAETGQNLDLSPSAREESARLKAAVPAWSKALEKPLKILGKARRYLEGTYTQDPFDYSIYTRSSPTRRVNFHVADPTCVWWSRAPRSSGGFYRRLRKQLGGRG